MTKVSRVSLNTLDINFRFVLDEDFPFLLTLYASTRAAELQATGWSDEQKSIFIRSQFQLQHHYYQQQFSTAQFLIITNGTVDIGRLYYGWEENNLRLIDIALLPDYQNRGIGTAIMFDLMEQASGRGTGIALHVELTNFARHWYLHLGFVGETDDGIYQKMQWIKN